MPIMGYLITSAIQLLNDLNVTFLPHAEPPPEESIHKIIYIAHVRRNHAVRVQLKDDSPLPLIATM